MSIFLFIFTFGIFVSVADKYIECKLFWGAHICSKLQAAFLTIYKKCCDLYKCSTCRL